MTMVYPDFLRKFVGICLVLVQIQYAVGQINAFTTGAVTQPQTLSEVPLTLESVLKQQERQDAGLSTGSPAFTTHGPGPQAAPQSQAADFQSMLSTMNQQWPSTSNAGSTPMQPGMEEMMMKMMMQSFGQPATPTPEQLGFTHSGPSKQTAKPPTPEQNMMNMLMQQSQGEQSGTNMLLQYFLLMNAMKPATSSAASSASSITPQASLMSSPASSKTPASQISAPMPAAASTQGTSLTKTSPINGSPNTVKSNLVQANDSNISVAFSSLASASGLPSNQTALQNSISLKRLLLNRLLASNKLRLKRIRFFHENKQKETVITAANASSVQNPLSKTVPLNSTTKLKSATTGFHPGTDPQVSPISSIAPKKIVVPTVVNSVTPSPVVISHTKPPPRAQTTRRAKEVTTAPTPFNILDTKLMPRTQNNFRPIRHQPIPVTTPRPVILYTAPPSIPRQNQPRTWSSVAPKSASTAKNWRYPNYPNGHHQHQNSVMFQNQMPIQYQNQIQYQPVNQAPIQNYQMSQFTNQAAPGNQGNYQSVAYPNQNVAYPNQNVAYPNQNVAYPNQNVAYPNQNVAYPNENVAYPNQNVAYPNQNVAYPNQNVALPIQNVAYPSNSVVQTNQNVANPNMGQNYQNSYPNYAHQQPLGPNGYVQSPSGFQQPQPHQMSFPVPGQSSFPMPSDPSVTQVVSTPIGPVLDVTPLNPGIDSAEARAEYLEQNPPTEIPPAALTTPAPATTAMPILPSNPNPLFNTKQQKSNKQWAEMLHFLSKNFPDYLSLRSQVHQTALSSPMANKFRNLMAAKSNAAKTRSMGHGFGAAAANSHQGSQWMYTPPSTTPAGEPLEVELEFEPTPAGATTTPSPMHPFHAARAAQALGYEIAKPSNGQIFGGMFGQPIQQRNQNTNRNFDMFGMMTGMNAAPSNGFHGSVVNNRQGHQQASFFTNGHKNQNSQWGMNGAV